jgi:hypothetical protein
MNTRSFDAYLNSKKIDSITFKALHAALFQNLQTEYALLGEKAFDQRKKFLINEWRHLYPVRQN